jgi:hypothetical protein
MEWTSGKWRSMAHHYFVETVFISAQFLTAFLVYYIPGIVKMIQKKCYISCNLSGWVFNYANRERSRIQHTIFIIEIKIKRG